MALIIADRVKETTTTTGTGTINLAGANAGFQTFVSGIGTGNTTYYCITSGNDWEVGIGTVTSGSPDTLSRTTILASSNANAAITLSGTSTVFGDAPASLLTNLIRAPSFVQAAASVGTSSTVTFSSTPTQGNVLVAAGTHWANNPSFNAGWVQITNTNGAVTDGLQAAYKVCGSGESTSQTPFNVSTAGASTAVVEVTRVGSTPALVSVFQENGSGTLTLTSFNSPIGLVVGVFSVQASNFDYSISGATSIDANVTGTTTNNSPRRIKAFHVDGSFTVATVTATLDAGHSSAGFMFYIAG